MNDDATRASPSSLEQLQSSVATASAHAQSVYFAFLSLLAYVTVTVASTTHEQLLVGGDLQLPLLGVGLPLKSFYALAPGILFLFHAHVILQFFLLSCRLRTLKGLIRALPEERASAQRLRVFPFAFSEMLLNDSDHPRDVRLLLRAVVWWTAVAPTPAVLSLTLISFLPYHSHLITTWHWVLLMMDLMVLWRLWPLSVQESDKPWWKFQPVGWVTMVATVLLMFGVSLAAFAPLEGSTRLSAVLDRLVARNINLNGFDTTRPQPNGSALPPLNLNGRDLRYARLRNAVLRETQLIDADLTGADLTAAQLLRTNLTGAVLRGAALYDATLDRTILVRANLAQANLDLARLFRVQVEDANLSRASLHKAKLYGFELRDVDARGTKLGEAQLVAVDIKDSDLRTAFLGQARLIASSIVVSRLEGADFHDADLLSTEITFTSLTAVKLTGANVWDAKFTDLDQADLMDLRGLRQSRPADLSALLGDVCKILDSAAPEFPRICSGSTKAFDLSFVHNNVVLTDALCDQGARRLLPVDSVGLQAYGPKALHALVDLACEDADVAYGVVSRSSDNIWTNEELYCSLERARSPACPGVTDDFLRSARERLNVSDDCST